MEFNFEETTLYEHKDNAYREVNSYYIVSKDESVKESDLEKVIQIIDETGSEVTCTMDKFVEIFDQEGLSGFIM